MMKSCRKESNMKNTVRVSFDVPIDEHTFLKTECTKSRVPFRNLMREVFHKTVEEFRKKELHRKIKNGFKNAYEGKGKVITQKELDEWEKMIEND